MDRRILRWFLTLFGMVCAGIALAHIFVGPSAIPGSIPVNATMDSEDRFYATLFLGFGIAHSGLLAISRHGLGWLSPCRRCSLREGWRG